MGTYLVTWNPKKWAWDDLDDRVAEIAKGERRADGWSTGNTKRIQPGDRLFLMRLGGNIDLKGLMASAYATSPVTRGKHFTNPQKSALYVNLDWEILKNPEKSGPIIPLEELMQPPLDSVNWQSMSSGISIPDNVASYLERRWAELTKANSPSAWFNVSNTYTRHEIKTILGVPAEHGDWETGYHRHGADWYIFANVGNAGRTGHDYKNHWVGDQLLWYGKTGRKLDQQQTRDLLSAEGWVHIFTRSGDRDRFTYEGVGIAEETFATSPFSVRWRIMTPVRRANGASNHASALTEGAPQQALVTVYERNPKARRDCISHYGAQCVACGFNFGDDYGAMGEGFIHVHHLREIASIGAEYEIDPIKDMRPVCPNCHAMIHKRKPAMTIEQIVEILDAQREL